MPKLINKRSREELIKKATDDIVTLTDLRAVIPQSTLDGVIRAVSTRMAEFYEDLDVNFLAAYLPTATGPYLDALAQDRQLNRLVFTETQIPCNTDTVILRTKNGAPLFEVLGVVANAEYATFPKGVAVTSETAQEVFFETYETSTIVPGVSVVSLGVAASLSSGQILPEGTLNVIDFTNDFFVGTDTSNLEIVQVKDITGIQTFESDESLRYRIAAHLSSAAGGNELAIRAAVMSHPEVADVKIDRNVRGTGSFDVIVYPRQNRISQLVLREFEQMLQETASFGENFKVKQPDYVALSVNLSCLVEQQASVRSKMDAFVDDLSNKTIGYSRLKSYMNGNGLDIQINRLTVGGKDLLPASNITILTSEIFELRARVPSESAVEFT
jgi:uncharacterized phage protein gp47/JayE